MATAEANQWVLALAMSMYYEYCMFATPITKALGTYNKKHYSFYYLLLLLLPELVTLSPPLSCHPLLLLVLRLSPSSIPKAE